MTGSFDIMSSPHFNSGEFAGIKPLEFERFEFYPHSNSTEFDGIGTTSTFHPMP